jgi:hypothetical protein
MSNKAVNIEISIPFESSGVHSDYRQDQQNLKETFDEMQFQKKQQLSESENSQSNISSEKEYKSNLNKTDEDRSLSNRNSGFDELNINSLKHQTHSVQNRTEFDLQITTGYYKTDKINSKKRIIDSRHIPFERDLKSNDQNSVEGNMENFSMQIFDNKKIEGNRNAEGDLEAKARFSMNENELYANIKKIEKVNDDKHDSYHIQGTNKIVEEIKKKDNKNVLKENLHTIQFHNDHQENTSGLSSNGDKISPLSNISSHDSSKNNSKEEISDIDESHLVAATSNTLEMQKNALKMKIEYSKQNKDLLEVKVSDLEKEFKQELGYLMQLKENSFDLKVDIDVLNMQISKVKELQKKELEDTTKLEQQKKNLVTMYEKQCVLLKKNLEALYQQETYNKNLNHKLDTVCNYGSQLKEITSFIEKEFSEIKQNYNSVKFVNETSNQRKFVVKIDNHNITHDPGYSTPKPQNFNYNGTEHNLPSQINSTYRLDDPATTHNKKLDEILELMKTIQKPNDVEINTFRSKDQCGEFQPNTKSEHEFNINGNSNLESNKQINQTFVIFNKMLMDFLKELPKFFISFKKVNTKIYENLRLEFSRFSDSKIRRLNSQMLELSKKKDAPTSNFLERILDFFREERDILRKFLENLTGKIVF